MKQAGIALLASLALSGCASLSTERNLAETARFARAQFGAELRALNSEQARAEAQREVERLLEQPLAQDDAVRLALAHSPAFQAVLSESAANSARATQSARLPNPVFALEKLVRREHGEREVEFGRMLAFSLLDIFYLPSRIGLANQTQQRLRWQTATHVVDTVREARESWVKAVAAQQSLVYFTQVMEAAEAGAELARRMQATGNFSRLQRAREHAFYAEAAAQFARARQAHMEAREALVRRLGLNAQQAARLRLPERLPDVPASVRDEKGVLQKSLDERLDVRMARDELESVARQRGLTNVQSLFEGWHVGLISNSETGKPVQRGFEIELPVPLFDAGGARRAEAQADYMAAVHRAQQTTIEAGSQVRQQYAAYKTAWELARHYRDEIVPLRKTISEEQLLKYNGMLIGVFDLLADAREQIGSVVAAIEAERDYWLADAALQATLLGKPANAPGSAARLPQAAGPGH